MRFWKDVEEALPHSTAVSALRPLLLDPEGEEVEPRDIFTKRLALHELLPHKRVRVLFSPHPTMISFKTVFPVCVFSTRRSNQAHLKQEKKRPFLLLFVHVVGIPKEATRRAL